MTIFFASDHHFGHSNIIKYEARDFAGIEHMNTAMIQAWNKVVKPEDTIYHLGDFALTKKDWVKPLVMSLNGTKHLILGNHDRSAKFMMECGFVSAQTNNAIFLNNLMIEMVHDPMEITKRPLFADVILHGHIHGKKKLWTTGSKIVHVGVDAWDYKPVSLEEILNLIKEGKCE